MREEYHSRDKTAFGRMACGRKVFDRKDFVRPGGLEI
jgi:hypothetical protein